MMKNIFIFKNGKTAKADIKKLFLTHGPDTIEGKRLDHLKQVKLMTDANVLAKNDENRLTVELIFNDSNVIYIQVSNLEDFHWLLSYANEPEWPESVIKAEKLESLLESFNQNLDEVYDKTLKNIDVTKEKIKNIDGINLAKINENILQDMYKAFLDTSDAANQLEYNNFYKKYSDYVQEKTLSLFIKDSDYKVNYDDKVKIKFSNIFIVFIVLISVYYFSNELWFVNNDEDFISDNLNHSTANLVSEQAKLNQASVEKLESQKESSKESEEPKDIITGLTCKEVGEYAKWAMKVWQYDAPMVDFLNTRTPNQKKIAILALAYSSRFPKYKDKWHKEHYISKAEVDFSVWCESEVLWTLPNKLKEQ